MRFGKWRLRAAQLALSPTWLTVIVVYLGTMAWTVALSFTNSRLLPSWDWAGFAQYQRLFDTSKWNLALQNLVIFGVLYVFGCLVLGFLLAAALDRRVRFESAFRTLFLYPYAMSFVVTGLIWQWLMNPTLGIQPTFQGMGWENFRFDWVTNRTMAIYAVVLAGIWQGSGLVMVLALAGMRGIDAEQWRAARIDGIPVWRVYLSIILPQLGPAMAAAATLLSMGVIKTYDLVIALTKGGPGSSTEVPAKFIMDNMFQRQNLGLATAAAVVLLLSVVLVVAPFRYAAYITAKRRAGQL
ncbi:carbohydrate ABC transporter permease [Ketogulonicigenium vulgare]|uniref:Probable sugar ABC transporter, permease protein n=1 Tax=Ketogulonicigenium vulgare (strain WSH-001) TaxID=759362 RepID=F9YB84_KETVW|nr:sugar ABC transporter permease [Ketogulonicigenium vulgare]AEM42636.1 probable sugar ABC transporter, permease protein [Ketogulonicigenium vulgare WSH-001]ALJ82442.1 sugar ABC transporter permease [Ketogulonicigenium vulgare]ANW35230.1 sugar ABC transporter permease [Ketogulonicigenium vulgare]AOZ53338.1 putative sugar ABC transporter, permease protein [Ketogulonicigenium vulgare]